ncbi:MAG: protein kinase [Caulobacter sp.]|nr:protein kinase [Caulobacter sp.]
MITHPTSSELIEAVIRFIEERAAPQLKDRDAFLARVAVNALNTVRREIEQGPAAEAAAVERLKAILGRDGTWTDLNDALCAGIEDGSIDASAPAVMAHLKASIIDQVRIDQPNYAGLKTLTGG